MLNDIDFDFVDFGIPNLVWAKSKATPPSKPVRLADKLAPLAYEAAKKFPKWVFMGTPQWGYDDRMEVPKLNVYENREKIGTLSINTTRTGAKYVIESDRIKQARKRGDGAQTGDIKKALALMTKHFGSKTIEEKSREAYDKLAGALGSSHNTKSGEYNHVISALLRNLEVYALANFEATSAAAIAAGAKADVINKIPEHKDDRDTVSTIHSALHGKRGRFVMIDGSDYVVSKSLDFEPELYSTDTLPAPIKLGIGMLKLLEDNHFMKDVGFRLNATTFYVLAEPD
jgi:hypothetical protein